MRENVLKGFETFDEFPNKSLKIDINSDYYYIKKQDNNYIAKRNIDLITNIDDEKVLIKCSYYNVINGSLIHKIEFISNINGINKEFIKCDNAKVISLSDILNIEDKEVYYLKQKDISNIIKNKSKSKVYKK